MFLSKLLTIDDLPELLHFSLEHVNINDNERVALVRSLYISVSQVELPLHDFDQVALEVIWIQVYLLISVIVTGTIVNISF